MKNRHSFTPYKKLPGAKGWWDSFRLKDFVGKGYLGPDHLLIVKRDGYSESYLRFAYTDIQAIMVRKTWEHMLFKVPPALIIFFALLSAWLEVASADWYGFTACLILFGPPLLFSLYRGVSCRVYLKTSASFEEIPIFCNERSARKGMKVLQPIILQAQMQPVETAETSPGQPPPM